MELLKLNCDLRNNNPDALVFEEAKITCAKASGVPPMLKQVCRTVSECFIRLRHAYATDMANKGMELAGAWLSLGHID